MRMQTRPTTRRPGSSSDRDREGRVGVGRIGRRVVQVHCCAGYQLIQQARRNAKLCDRILNGDKDWIAGIAAPHYVVPCIEPRGKLLAALVARHALVVARSSALRMKA